MNFKFQVIKRDGWKGEYVGRRYQEGTLLMEVC